MRGFLPRMPSASHSRSPLPIADTFPAFPTGTTNQSGTASRGRGSSRSRSSSVPRSARRSCSSGGRRGRSSASSATILMHPSKSVSRPSVVAPYASACESCSSVIFACGRRTTARIPGTSAAYAASAADVSPVEAQPTSGKPQAFAHVTPAVMPRSLKESVGFSPSCLTKSRERPSSSPSAPPA